MTTSTNVLDIYSLLLFVVFSTNNSYSLETSWKTCCWPVAERHPSGVRVHEFRARSSGFRVFFGLGLSGFRVEEVQCTAAMSGLGRGSFALGHLGSSAVQGAP